MSWIFALGGLFLLYQIGKVLFVVLRRVGKMLVGALTRLYRRWRPLCLYRLQPRQNLALALAHPMAMASFGSGFAQHAQLKFDSCYA